MWRGAFFPVIVLGLAGAIWVLSVAASESDWYKWKTDVLNVEISVKYYLTHATSTSCVGSTCYSYTANYNTTSSGNESNGEKEFRNVHTTTRAMIILAILIDTFFIIYLIALVLCSFVLRVEGIFKLYSKLLWIIGLILAGLTTVFVSLSWLTYFGITKAFKDSLSSPLSECTDGPCKSFSGSNGDTGTTWGPGTGFALGIVCTALGGAAITIFFLRGKK